MRYFVRTPKPAGKVSSFPLELTIEFMSDENTYFKRTYPYGTERCEFEIPQGFVYARNEVRTEKVFDIKITYTNGVTTHVIRPVPQLIHQ